MKAHSISAVLGGVSLIVLAALTVGAADVIVTQNPPGLNFLGFNTIDSPFNGPPLFDRVPLKNRMDLKVRFENATGKPLTFREGALYFLDASDTLMGKVDISPTEFLERRRLSDGSAFGNGRVVIAYSGNYTQESFNAGVVDASSRYFLAGDGLHTDGTPSIVLGRIRPEGDPDDTFAGGGKLALKLSDTSELKIRGAAISEGLPLFAGSVKKAGKHQFLVGRRKNNGDPDTTFGGPGNASGIVYTPLTGTVTAAGVVVDSNDRIVTVGYNPAGISRKVIVTRHLSTGALDPKFANGGVLSRDVSDISKPQVTAVAEDSEGRLLIAGHQNVAQAPRWFVMRLLSDGAADLKFGTGGVATALPPGTEGNLGYFSDCELTAMTITSDDGIVLGGRFSYFGVEPGYFIVGRFESDGGIRATFGESGWAQAKFPSLNARMSSIRLGSAGSILAAGSATGGEHGVFAVAKWKADGSSLQTFGPGGRSTLGFEELDAKCSVMFLLPDSRIVLAGTGVEDESGTEAIVLGRLLENGRPDPTVQTPIGVNFSLDFLDFPYFNDGASQSFDAFPRKTTPAKANLQLQFAEFGSPLFVSNIPLQVYEQNANTYQFPLRNSARAFYWKPSQSHEAFSAHTGSWTQRYAYDIVAVDSAVSSSQVSDAEALVPALIEKYKTHPNFDPEATYKAAHFSETYRAFGEPVYAMADGVIIDFDDNQLINFPVPEKNANRTGGGNFVRIDHGNGEFSFHAHLVQGSISEMLGTVQKGITKVKQGQKLGRLGNSGSSTGPHHHFEICYGLGTAEGRGQARPLYFNNVRFRNNATAQPLQQLRSDILTGTLIEVLPQPYPADPSTAKVVYGPGEANETEGTGNNTLASAQALVAPVTLHGSIQPFDVDSTQVADAGDGIEEIFKFYVPKLSVATATLSFPAGEDLDLHIYTAQLRAIKPSTGATRAGQEKIVSALSPGVYYLFVSVFDPARRTSAINYTLNLKITPSGLKFSNALSPTGGRQMVLGFPSDLLGEFALETTEVLGSGARWRLFETRGEVNADEFKTSIPNEGPSRFFRLLPNLDPATIVVPAE